MPNLKALGIEWDATKTWDLETLRMEEMKSIYTTSDIGAQDDGMIDAPVFAVFEEIIRSSKWIIP